MNTHASSVTLFPGVNFSEWREQVNFHLGVQDLDLAHLKDEHVALTAASTETE